VKWLSEFEEILLSDFISTVPTAMTSAAATVASVTASTLVSIATAPANMVAHHNQQGAGLPPATSTAETASTRRPGIPPDGTVHEITSQTMNYLRRLVEYKDCVDVFLPAAMAGSRAFNTPPPSDLCNTGIFISESSCRVHSLS